MRTAQEFADMLGWITTRWHTGNVSWLEAIQELSKEEICDYQTEIKLSEYVSHKISDEGVRLPSGRWVDHTLEKPRIRLTAGGRECLGYFLFNHRISQRTWFQLTNQLPEEQLAHMLKWGRHDR